MVDGMIEQTEHADPAAVAAKAKQTLPTRTVEGRPLEVPVEDAGLDRAIRKLNRKMANEGVAREMKRRRHYEKPSVRKRRKQREAERRRRRRERRLTRKVLPPMT